MLERNLKKKEKPCQPLGTVILDFILQGGKPLKLLDFPPFQRLDWRSRCWRKGGQWRPCCNIQTTNIHCLGSSKMGMDRSEKIWGTAISLVD